MAGVIIPKFYIKSVKDGGFIFDLDEITEPGIYEIKEGAEPIVMEEDQNDER